MEDNSMKDISAKLDKIIELLNILADTSGKNIDLMKQNQKIAADKEEEMKRQRQQRMQRDSQRSGGDFHSNSNPSFRRRPSN